MKIMDIINTMKIRNKSKKGVAGWLMWALAFLILAIVSGIFGFDVISGASYVIAKWLAFIFVLLFIIYIIAHTIKKA